MKKILPEPISFADVVHQTISFDPNISEQKLVLDLIETPFAQRLRDISQSVNTKLVYMFYEHSRFGHSLGTAYLACQLLTKLEQNNPKEIIPYKEAVAAAAILHDIGHLAPGSHLAFKIWFPHLPDQHEHLASKIIMQDPCINQLLRKRSHNLPQMVSDILLGKPSTPLWCRQLISGGGWNVDRGNWCIVDSIMAGVSYGHYNIPALTGSIQLTKGGSLALRENRLDAMVHFAVSRHAMYRQIYQHRVLLSADLLYTLLIKRIRELIGDRSKKRKNKIKILADETMQSALKARKLNDLNLDNIYAMRESWFRYHLNCWQKSDDPIVSDLADRIINRRLFKTIKVNSDYELKKISTMAERELKNRNLDPRYYQSVISTKTVHASERKQSIKLLDNSGKLLNFEEKAAIFRALTDDSRNLSEVNRWLAVPSEIKQLLESKK